MTHGSLFSGIGGFDLAAEWMGWENVFHCEWNEFGKKVLHHYWPQSISYHDITKTDFTIHRGKIAILTGGFPCQPYSSAGKRKGKEDERHLWPSMLRAIREIQPRWVVGENVLGLVNWSGGLVFHEVQADLEAAGYEVWPYVLPAAGVGSCPHRRDRVWFVAYSKLYANGLRTERGMDLGGELLERPKRKEKTNGLDNISKNERLTPHPNGNGLNQRNGNDEEQPGEGGFNALGNADTGNEYGDVADTDSKRGQKCNISGKSIKSFIVDRRTNENPRDWQNFPTQSPIRSRNDGLSTKLDGITFSKWRNESIKAAGNAIVPQVVYQIFKAIEQYETLPRMADTI
jgi:DNA (cytosine-5)-methyltransferase 1